MESLRGFLETLKLIKHESPQPKLCPSCMSTKIYPKKSYGIYPAVYCCKDCDYEGHIVLEKEPEDKG